MSHRKDRSFKNDDYDVANVPYIDFNINRP